MSPLASYRPALPPPTTLDQPWLRQSVKLILDGGLATGAWAACQFIFRGTHTTPLGALRWTFLALGVNLVFQLTFQHYRLIGFRDALRIAMATLSLLCLSALLNLVLRENTFLPDLGVAAASALTAPCWLSKHSGMSSMITLPELR